MNLDLTAFYWVLPSFSGSHCVLPSFTGFSLFFFFILRGEDVAGGAISSLLSDREIRLGRKKRTAINATAPAGRCVTEFFFYRVCIVFFSWTARGFRAVRCDFDGDVIRFRIGGRMEEKKRENSRSVWRHLVPDFETKATKTPLFPKRCRDKRRHSFHSKTQ